MSKKEKRKIRNVIILAALLITIALNIYNVTNYDEARHITMEYVGQTQPNWFSFAYEDADVSHMTCSYEYTYGDTVKTDQILRKNVEGSVLKYIPFHIAEYVYGYFKDTGEIVVQFTKKDSIIYITIQSKLNASIGDQTRGVAGTIDKKPIDFLGDFHYVSMENGKPIALIFESNAGERVKVFIEAN